MAITTLDGLIAGTVQLRLYLKNGSFPVLAANTFSSLWGATGGIAAGAAPGNTTAGLIPTSSSVAGGIPFENSAGLTTLYLLSAMMCSTITAVMFLWDRVWHGGSFTPTTGAIAGVTGTAVTRPSSGEGNQLWLEVQTTLGTATHVVTITYTNSDGTASRTAVATTMTATVAGRMYPVPLQAGDRGVRQVTGISGNASTTGSFNVLILRPLAVINGVTAAPDYVELGRSGMVEILDDSCIFAGVLNTSAAAMSVAGGLTLVSG